MRIYLEFPDATSPKFWEGSAQGKQLTTRWGRVGATGQSKTATLATAAAAEAELQKKAKAKIKKGYADAVPPNATPSTAPVVSSSAASTNGAKPVSAPKTNQTKTPEKTKKGSGGEAILVAKQAPSLEPTPLAGDLLPLVDFPNVFAFSADGTTLAAHGFSTLHIVDWAKRSKTTYKSKEARAVLFHDDGNLIVGTRSIGLIDPTSGKKLSAMKGHKAPAHDLATDGVSLFTAGGDYAATHDRFVRAYDLSTGDLRWKSKPGKNAGALSLALVDDNVAVAAEDGAIRLFRADDGAALSEVQLALPVTHGSAFGGVARVGTGLVAAAAEDRVCRVHWLRHDSTTITADDVTTLPLRDVDPNEGMVVGPPQSRGGLVIVPVYYCINGMSRVVVAVLDATSHDVAAIWKPTGLNDTKCGLGPDGTLVWAVADGLASAALV